MFAMISRVPCKAQHGSTVRCDSEIEVMRAKEALRIGADVDVNAPKKTDEKL
jgi:hypothetical protein